MPEVMQRRTFGDAYEVQLTNDRVSGYWAWIFRKDGTSDKLRMKSKEHYADVLSRVGDSCEELARGLLGSGLLDEAIQATRLALAAELAGIRSRGYAFDLGEHKIDVHCVAAPIRASNGRVIGAISISGEAGRLPTARLDRIAPYVMSHAAAISRRLGHVEDVPELDETRVAQELALLAVKADVTEEIERLTAHIAAARALLADGKPAGRRLDFLAQEFNREANTLCAKAGSAPLTAIGLDLKAEIDRMREQIQNVE